MFVESLDVVIIQNELVEYQHSLQQMISEFKVKGLDYLRLKAVAMNYLPFDRVQFINEVEESLSSFEEQQVIDALSALNQLLCKDDKLDSKCIDVLSTFIKYSRGQYLSNAFQVVINIIYEKRTYLYSQFENTVLSALGKVLSGFDLLDFEERLALRSWSAKLASDLNLYYVSNGKDVPPVLRLWEENCHSQKEFAEIRNRWKDY
ncbi:hypothetical protein [Vibrio cholerae]|uniref:hypothetical protein n=1 Tax=Vibrio cholerae TaxID=666 RepID=UPI00301BA846